MKPDETDRLAIVSGLIEMTVSLENVAAKLSKFEWDYEGQGVELTRQHLSHSLKRYLQGSLTAKDIEQWANTIETREDIYFESTHEEKVGDVLHELANPTLAQLLNESRAKKLLDILTG